MIKLLLKKIFNSQFGRLIPDKLYIKSMYRLLTGQKLNLDCPETFSEKIQWLKLYNRKPEYTFYADKYQVRKFIAEKIGEEYLVPLLGVWERPDEIDFTSLPDEFVLKCNHNSGKGMYICKDKNKMDARSVIKVLKKGFRENYFYKGREWPYKNIKKRIIAEKLLVDDTCGLVDYKFYCFNGYVDCVLVCIDRHINNTKFYFFDKDWNLKRINSWGKEAPDGFTLYKPKNLDKMFEIAQNLSQDFPFIRVDLYESNGKIYFGELTFFPNSGFSQNFFPETNNYFGNLISLSTVQKKQN